MPIDTDLSVQDEAYLATIAAEPKMTMDEVGADIEEHGHVPVTPENATQDPFTAKGSLSYALDESLSADTDLEHTTMTRDKNDNLDSHLFNPTDDFRDETKDEVEGTTDTPQGLIQPVESNKVGEGLEPTIQQDKAVHVVKDSLAEALDAITMDGAEEIEAKPPIGKDPEPDYSKYDAENASHIPLKSPDIPPSLGGDEDKPDSNGLVYVSATFTVDPEKYISANYRPTNVAQAPNAASAKRLFKEKKPTAVNPEEETALSDLGTPEAKASAQEADEPTAKQEEAAAKEADKEQKEEQGAQAIPQTKDGKATADSALEAVVLDYATFIDGSSFICYDEISDIDYSKIAMDAGPKKAPTRANCQTTFAQCRAKNPLYCRFHGPKLLEADIKTQIKAGVGGGCTVSVTKDKNSKNKFAFRVTVGCPPSKKKKVEYFIHMYMTQQPGISSSQEAMKDISPNGDTGLMTQEFEMDILQADKSPKEGKNDTLQKVAMYKTANYKAKGQKQPVVGTTPSKIEKAANGVAPSQVQQQEEQNEETGEKKPEAATVEAEETTEEPAAPEAQQEQAEEPKVEKPVSKPTDKSDGTAVDRKVTKEDILDFFGNKTGKIAKADLQKWLELANNGTYEGGSPTEYFDAPSPAYKNVGEGLQKIMEMKGADHPMTKALVKAGLPLPEGMEGAESGRSEEVVLPAPPVLSKGNEGVESPQSTEGADAKKNAAFDKVKKALAGTGYENADLAYDDFGDTQEVYIATSENGEGTLEAVIGKDGGLTFGVHDNNGFWGNSDNPSHAISDFEKNYGVKPPVPSYGGKAHELASKLSDLQHQFHGLVDSGADASAVDSLNNLLTGAKMTYDKLAAEYDALDELDAQMKAVGEDSDLFEVDKTFEQKLIEEAKGKTQGKISLLLNELESKIGGIEHTFAAANKKGADKKKGQVADAVEEAIKNLGVYVYGGKRPPQGVDSITDYLDYMKDEMESDGETNLSPDEMSDIEDQYHLEDAYNATKAASKAMDDAIAAFKDKMDEIPSQGEDNGTYQNDIEQLKNSILSASGELMANFASYKQALEKCKYEAAAAQKLAESKKALAGGASAQGASSGGAVTKADIEDFFGQTFDENDSNEKNSLDLWKELATEGTLNGDSPSHYFESMGGWLQGLMKHKGADHPMTKALVKAGLNLPKGMEQQAQGKQGGEGETKQDLSQKVGDPYSSLQHDIKPLISHALSINGGFTNFDTFNDTTVDGTTHYISMEKKQKEGFNEDEDDAVAPTTDELATLEKNLNDEFNRHGLFVKPSTHMKNYGKKVYFEVGKKDSVEPSKKQAEPSTPAKSQMSDEEKKAKIAAMSPKQKLEAAVKIFKKKLAANPNDATAKAKLTKYEAMLSKLNQ